jgi:CRISPR-associated exonuclease Cas4
MSGMLTVGELKQFIYCPRIFYFMAVQPMQPPATHLMERGHRLQEEFERLEPRRVLSRYGLQDARRYFSLPLSNEGLGIGGQLDLLLETTEKLAVVEFKASGAGLAENHRFQLAAYALLAERHFGKPCASGFAVFVDRGQIEEIKIDLELRRKVNDAIIEMQSLLRTQEFPPATCVRARCTNCEFQHFCGDIF